MPTATWFTLAAIAYATSTVFYLLFLAGASGPVLRAAAVTLVVGFVAHTLDLGAHGLAGLHPASSARETAGFLSWLLVGMYLLSSLRWRLDAVAAFLVPVALMLLLGARLSPPVGPASMAGLGVLGRVHISLATAGVTLFAMATGLASLYLVEERALKQKQLGGVVKRGVALATLDTLVHRCVQIGFPIFTVAMVTGAVWSAQRSEGMRAEYVIAGVAWAAFAALLVARMAAGWRGRRAAMMTIIGFTASLIVLAIYVVRAAVGA